MIALLLLGYHFERRRTKNLNLFNKKINEGDNECEVGMLIG